ncbi:prepilin-type N-terminal cleavage/methylation domain-containing protein, partial [Xanthomonas axonopodis pv. begoniae]|nr:prepilin-type N-terminal cleavage/methylation domain-containing protein [Xanthomonas axonopodis pv. begoniae]
MGTLIRKTAFDRRESAFTLIELMVTVAVLAIVMAVAVPAFGTLIRSSRLTARDGLIN